MFKLILKNQDITPLIHEVTLSGGYNQCVRTLDFSIAYSDTDPNIPYIKHSLADKITFTDKSGKVQFSGCITKKRYDHSQKVVNVTAMDKGLYLKKNEGQYSFNNAFPENIARTICVDYGIEVSSVASTGVKISKTFLGNNLYDIIMASYTKASEQNGKKYFLGFEGDKLFIREKYKSLSPKWLRGDINLLGISAEESFDNMINRVAIYDKNNKLVKYVQDNETIEIFGLMTKYLRQTSGDNKIRQAQKSIKENGVKKSLKVKNIGDWSYQTGESVYVYDAYSGINATFFIDADIHTFKQGVYTNSLTLNFENIMDVKDYGDNNG